MKSSSVFCVLLSWFQYLVGVTATFIFLLLPRQLLVTWVEDKVRALFYPRWDFIIWYKSGRSALYAVFSGLYMKHGGIPVLVPDYICNVVHRAAAAAKLTIVVYKTNDDFSVDVGDLKKKIRSSGAVVVLLASIAGCQNNQKWLIDTIFRENSEAFIVLDECQNLISPSGIEPVPGTVVVFSFNMKQVPGLMGAGVCCSRESAQCLPKTYFSFQHDLKLNLQLFLSFGAQICNKFKSIFVSPVVLNKLQPPNLEYSECCRIDYEIALQSMAKISFARAFIAMLGTINRQRVRRYNYQVIVTIVKKLGVGDVVVTERGDLAPFIPFISNDNNFVDLVSFKGPYAVDCDSSYSLRPDLRYIKNDGICRLREIDSKFGLRG